MIGSIDLSRSRKDKLDNPNSEVAGMSHQAGASGPRTGNGGAGLRSSIWNSPSGQAAQVPLQQIQNISPAPHANGKSYIPPHLRQSAPKNQVQNVNPAYQSPHLKGFNAATMANMSPSQHTPKQVKSVSFNIPQDSGLPATPVTNIDMQRQVQSSSNNVQAVAEPRAKSQEAVPLRTIQSMSGGETSKEDAFLSYMNKKVSKDLEAKKAAIKKARMEAVQPERVQPSAAKPSQPWPEAQPSVPVPPRPKFIPNAVTDKAFQTFISTQINTPAAKGKMYTFTGSQKVPQALPVTSKAVENDATNLPAINTNLDLRGNASGEADPRSLLSPPGLVSKTSPPFMSNDVAPSPPTMDANVESGFVPRSVTGDLDDKISDTVVEGMVKENVRASQGEDPRKEFLDWDGKSWRPPPVDWETDRPGFDNSFMPKYVREDWEPSVPRGPSVAIDTKDPKYELAVSIGEQGFEAPIDYPMTFPDVTNSENEKKRRHQTSDVYSQRAQKRAEMKEKADQQWAEAHAAHNLQIETREPEEHPFAPKIDMYLRPATQTDVKGIMHIYNHYVLNSMATEDQVALTEDNIDYLIQHTKAEKLPIIVAVRGKMPLPSDTKPLNRSTQKEKTPLSQFEVVIGFGYAEPYYYGITGARSGRTRFTAHLQFYVHPDFTRKRVGLSLLDRLIQSMSYGYGAKDGYDWMNPTDDPVYKAGGVGKWHQLLIQYAVLPKDDPNYEMMTDYLRRFYFFEEGRIGSIAISCPSSNRSQFADLVVYLKQASDAAEFALIGSSQP